MIWEGPVVRSNFSCLGDEDCLSMCQSDEHIGICQQFAAVTCHGKGLSYKKNISLSLVTLYSSRGYRSIS